MWIKDFQNLYIVFLLTGCKSIHKRPLNGTLYELHCHTLILQYLNDEVLFYPLNFLYVIDIKADGFA